MKISPPESAKPIPPAEEPKQAPEQEKKVTAADISPTFASGVKLPTPAYRPAPPPAQPMNKNWLYIIGGALVVILAVLAYFSIGKVEIAPQPAADAVYINNKKIDAQSIRRLPGTFTVKIEKNGYLTYEKRQQLGFHKTLKISPALKSLSIATNIGKDALAPLTAGKDGGVKAVSGDRQYLQLLQLNKDKKSAADTLNLNLDPLPGIKSAQYPADQTFALLTRDSEIGIIDFTRRAVTKQDYSTYGKNIGSIALSGDGKEVFYWQYDAELKKNFLVRDNLSHTQADRYFDQPLLDQLGLTSPILRWSQDKKFVLAIEGKVVLIDVINRQAQTISYSQDIVDAWLTPNNKTLVAITKDNKLITINLAATQSSSSSSSTTSATSSSTASTTVSNSSANSPYPATEHDISAKPELSIVKDNTYGLFFTTDGKLIQYDFDAKSKIEYLVDKSLMPDKVIAMAADFSGKMVYFLVGKDIYAQPLIPAIYE